MDTNLFGTPERIRTSANAAPETAALSPELREHITTVNYYTQNTFESTLHFFDKCCNTARAHALQRSCAPYLTIILFLIYRHIHDWDLTLVFHQLNQCRNISFTGP